ncbi:hypothetical protein A9K65_019240 [Mesorhizobium sp. WSM1497]|nr:hypothetical protein A9K65_019240 [Mesorhizobium sp. WSM1497]
MDSRRQPVNGHHEEGNISTAMRLAVAGAPHAANAMSTAVLVPSIGIVAAIFSSAGTDLRP